MMRKFGLLLAVILTAIRANPTSAQATIWENYDFVPGSKVLFFTDFSEDRVGNFARRLKYVKGPVEVVERDDVKMLRASGPAQFLIPIGRELPERFTLEFDVIASAGGALRRVLSFEGGVTWSADAKSAAVSWNPQAAFIEGSGGNMGTTTVHLPDATQQQVNGKIAHLRVLMDGPYFKMYVNERRLYNMPELTFRRDSVVRVLLDGAEGNEVYLASIRVAESETDVLYDALANKGRWATQGILFATGKAELQPESRPVLKEIAATLKQHADLKILIEGHTDNVGSAATNLTLSDARAAAVKAALVAEYGADGARITTKGFGDTKPAVPNTTAEGRAQNRRVEIVKQ
jgi:outer membrane protein OmpA-like peptidoglycan-associated protein